GQPEVARRAAHRGVALNPGDGPGWTNLALLCLGAGERDCAATAADGAIARSTTRQELVNAALVHEALGNHQAADRAYRLSALTNFWTTITVPWPRPVSFVAADVAGLEELGDTVQFNEVIALGVLRLPIEPDAYTNVHARILGHAFVGDYDQVALELDAASSAARAAPLTWELAALLARPLGRDPEEALRIAQVARGIPPRNEPPSPAGLAFDIATFRAYPGDELVAAAERLIPEVPWPWVLEPYLPAP
ncbi:MAG TPA: hypothetical protein VHK28_02465, partial [Candidatus Limnocylindria bacterium]|nr:hypothetical protein [Candidatus Limnocylindria bacterium]